LAGAGMSRVFVALERGLGPQGRGKGRSFWAAAGVNVERSPGDPLAAQLQHPHIVPLPSAGEAEGLPTHHAVRHAGEVAAARVAREGEFPVWRPWHPARRRLRPGLRPWQRSSFTRRQARHELLSGGVAVVTDFGVAKAVSASRRNRHHWPYFARRCARHPAYIGPGAGHRQSNTDHRADHALESSPTRCSPGTPRSAVARPAGVAAHVVEEPEPSSAPGPRFADGGCLVRDCLAKRPADRRQRRLR